MRVGQVTPRFGQIHLLGPDAYWQLWLRTDPQNTAKDVLPGKAQAELAKAIADPEIPRGNYVEVSLPGQQDFLAVFSGADKGRFDAEKTKHSLTEVETAEFLLGEAVIQGTLNRIDTLA